MISIVGPDRRSAVRSAAIAVALAGLASRPCSGQWTNATGDLTSQVPAKHDITIVSAVPGADEVIVGVAHGGLWATTSGGATWHRLDTDGKVDHITVQILFDPKNADVFWVSGMYGTGLLKTTDRGKSFSVLGTTNHLDGVGVDFTDEYRRTIVVGQHERARSILRSSSSGLSWIPIGENLPPGSGHSSQVIVYDADTYVVSTQTFGSNPALYRTFDGGQTWTKVAGFATQDPGLVTPDGVAYIRLSAKGPLARGEDKGRQWRVLPGPAALTPVLLPYGVLISAAGKQLYRSTDRGGTWTPYGIPAPAAILQIAYNSERKSIFAVTPSLVPNASSAIMTMAAR